MNKKRNVLALYVQITFQMHHNLNHKVEYKTQISVENRKKINSFWELADFTELLKRSKKTAVVEGPADKACFGKKIGVKSFENWILLLNFASGWM